MFHTKKGVSPLIATLLLMAFAIALGTVVMSWGRSYIETNAEFIEGSDFSGCSNVHLRLITVGGETQACYDVKEQNINLLIENGPELAIKNFNLQIIGTEKVLTLENILKEPLKRTFALKKQIPYHDIGTPKRIKLIPIIDINNVELYCDESSLIIERELHPCSS